MKDDLRSKVLPDLKMALSGEAQATKSFELPLSDFDIIELQNLFMTPTLYTLKTRTIATGRFLIKTLLESLQHYHHVGCLTAVDNYELDRTVFDLSKLYKKKESLPESIEAFFIENPHVDFVWVELTEKLLKRTPESHLFKICENFKEIPIAVVFYEE